MAIPNPDPAGAFVQSDNTQFFQIGAYIQEIYHGVFVYGAYTTIENIDTVDKFELGSGYVDNDSWYIKTGIRQRWHPLGHTVLYGEYQRWNQDAPFSVAAWQVAESPDCGATVTELDCTSEVQMWGLGIVEEIDAAAMSMWLTYRHLDADVEDLIGSTGKVGADAFQYVKFGALINF